MDPRAHNSFNQIATPILPEKVGDFFANPEAFQAFLETLEIANSNLENAPCLENAPRHVPHFVKVSPPPTQPFTWLPTYAPMALQQQQGAGTVLPRDKAEVIRQRQYAEQVRQLDAARLTP